MIDAISGRLSEKETLGKMSNILAVPGRKGEIVNAGVFFVIAGSSLASMKVREVVNEKSKKVLPLI